MSLPILKQGTAAGQRRSQRVVLAVPILVSGKRPDQSSFSERTTTAVVNAHGALILLHENVDIGQTVAIRNIGTDEEVVCTVAAIDPAKGGELMVGIEFPQANARFWRVSFPPADWSSRNPEAKRVVKPVNVAGKSPVTKK